jgi:hypothetical protein
MQGRVTARRGDERGRIRMRRKHATDAPTLNHGRGACVHAYVCECKHACACVCAMRTCVARRDTKASSLLLIMVREPGERRESRGSGHKV